MLFDYKVKFNHINLNPDLSHTENVFKIHLNWTTEWKREKKRTGDSLIWKLNYTSMLVYINESFIGYHICIQKYRVIHKEVNIFNTQYSMYNVRHFIIPTAKLQENVSYFSRNSSTYSKNVSTFCLMRHTELIIHFSPKCLF